MVVWCSIVAITSLLATMTLFGNRRLRIHSAVVLLSAFVWTVTFLFIMPQLRALTLEGTSELPSGTSSSQTALMLCWPASICFLHGVDCGGSSGQGCG
jgi:hypothetical protein